MNANHVNALCFAVKSLSFLMQYKCDVLYGSGHNLSKSEYNTDGLLAISWRGTGKRLGSLLQSLLPC